MKEIIEKYFRECAVAISQTATEKENIIKIAEVITDSAKKGGQLLVAGHGGSDSDASHIVGELLVGFKIKHGKPFPAINLYGEEAALTAHLNDEPNGYETFLQTQVRALGNRGSVLWGISTSGNSLALIKAFEEAKRKGVITFGLLGKGGGKLKELCDYSIIVPHNDTPIIQTVHNVIYHAICEIVEKKYNE